MMVFQSPAEQRGLQERIRRSHYQRWLNQ